MKKSNFTTIIGISLFSIALAACGGGKNYAANNEKFKIGVSGPLTGSAANYGVAVKNGAELACNEINAAGGLNGKQFASTALDDQLLADKAATNYSSLYESGMQISLGAVTSGACIEFVKYAHDDGVFALCPSATNDAVTEPDNVYQMCFSDSGQGTAAAEYVNQNYADKSVGVFYDSSDSYSKGIYDNFKKGYKGTITEASFTSDAKTDFSAQANKLKDCSFVFLPIYYTEASIFIAQSTVISGTKNEVYFGCDGLDGIDTIEGFDVNKISQEISYLSHFNAAATDEATVDFVANYTKTYGAATLNQFGAAAYDCVYAIFEAMKDIEKDGTEIAVNIAPAELNKLLKEKFSTFKFNGITGSGSEISWNADGTVSKIPTKYVVNAHAE